ncbi:MAG: hypothetical protein LBI60_06235 [Bacteroidales bacterium]|jgi:hypothetical protein|nr:hypothetical protein [Bacteroidales bacterium]
MNIQGGALEFEVLFNNGQIDKALEETKRRVQGFTDSTVAGGKKMEEAYQAAASFIKGGFDTIGNAIHLNETAIANLQKKYNDLGVAAAEAFAKGKDAKYGQLTQQQSVTQDEIDKRKKLVAALYEQDAALAKHNQLLEDEKTKVDNAANAQVRFRTQLLNVKQQMMELEQAGKKNTAEYARLTEEAKRLANAMYAANQQIKTLTTTKGAMLSGFVSGLSGVSGAFTAANGAMGLFAGKNEELQKIMLRVQSLMSITMGLQAVSATLHETSAFRLSVLTKVQTAYSAAVFATGKALIVLGASESTARIAAQALMATLTLGLGVAITAIITLITKWVSESNKAKEANKQIAKSVSEQTASLMKLSEQWKRLGNDLDAQKKFLRENGEEITKLTGKTLELSQANDLFTKNTGKFIEALILRARAEAQYQKLQEKTAKLAEIDNRFDDEYERLAKKGTLKRPDGTDYINKETGKAWLKVTSQKYFELKAQREKLKKESETFISEQIKLSDKEKEILTELGLYSVKGLEGSIAAVEATISDLKDKYKNATTDLERSALLKQIKTQENSLEKINLLKEKKEKKDPFIKNLEKQKKVYEEYIAWLNAGMAEEAQKEFSTLLKKGKTYKEYLQNRIDNEKLTSKEIHKLKTALAEETTTKTVMDEFQKILKSQMDDAKNVLSLIDLIKTKREELEKSDDPLKQQKIDILVKEGENAEKKQEDENRQLLKSYTNYLDEKINFELQYGERKKNLDLQLEKETNEDRRKIILAQLTGLEKDRKKYEKQTDNEDYDNLLRDYRSFEQKKTDITDEFNKKRSLLEDALNSSDITESQRMNVMQSLQELEREYKESLSDLSVDVLKQSDTWKKLFSDLDTLTVSEMLKMKKIIEGKFANMDLSTDALKETQEKLDKVTEHVQTKNPFAALVDAIGRYNKDKSKANFKDLFEGIGSSISFVKDSFDEVTKGLKAMGLAGDEETQKLLGDISEMAGAAANLAMGIASGNPMQIIQGSITLITSAFDVFNSKDRAADRAIRKHAESINALESAYKSLEYAIQKALGEDTYKYQKSAIENMMVQQKHLREMQNAEQDKKKGDKNKIKEFQEQYAEMGRQIEDAIAEIAASITQTTAKDLANELANAIVEAYGKGEDAAKSFEDVSRKVMQNAVKNALKLQFLEKPLQNAIEQLQRDMGFDEKGNGAFDGLTSEEQDRFKRATKNISAQFNQAMEMYKDLFKEMDDAGDPTTSLAGAIKGASQQDINLLAGQTNAVRVNQVESIEILRNSLIQLTMINANTNKANQYLERIEENTKNTPYDPLRSQGITV